MVIHANGDASLIAGVFLLRACPSQIDFFTTAPTIAHLDSTVLAAMREIGIHLKTFTLPSKHRLEDVGTAYETIIYITEGAQSTSELIPARQGARVEWSFPQIGFDEESLETSMARARILREMVRYRVEMWCKQSCSPPRRHRGAGRESPAGVTQSLIP